MPLQNTKLTAWTKFGWQSMWHFQYTIVAYTGMYTGTYYVRMCKGVTEMHTNIILILCSVHNGKKKQIVRYNVAISRECLVMPCIQTPAAARYNGQKSFIYIEIL